MNYFFISKMCQVKNKRRPWWEVWMYTLANNDVFPTFIAKIVVTFQTARTCLRKSKIHMKFSHNQKWGSLRDVNRILWICVVVVVVVLLFRGETGLQNSFSSCFFSIFFLKVNKRFIVQSAREHLWPSFFTSWVFCRR